MTQVNFTILFLNKSTTALERPIYSFSLKDGPGKEENMKSKVKGHNSW